MFTRGSSNTRSVPEPECGIAVAPGTDLGRCLDSIAPLNLLARNADLVQRVELAFGLDAASFKSTVRPMIEGLARFVNGLPAKSSPPFAQEGDLFRLSLLIGFYALQGTDGQIFSGSAAIAERKSLEERWRLAVFAAGLCAELYRAYDLVKVSDSARDTWSPYSMPLTDWLSQRHTAYLTWSATAVEHTAAALFSLPHVIPPAIFEYFRLGPEKVTAHMFASIGGVATWRSRNLIALLVRDASLAVFDHEQRRHADRESTTNTAVHWTGPIVQAMQRLARTNGGWELDTAKSRVIRTEDGTYLAWPAFAHDVIGLFEREGISAMPRHPDDILELLLNSKVIVRTPEGATHWPLTRSDEASPLLTLKLANPDLLAAPTFEPRSPSTSVVEDIIPGREELPLDSPNYRLAAPLRLHRTVAAGLQRALDELSAHRDHARLQIHRDGLVVTDSLFVALHIDPVTAYRSLSEAAMLVRGEDGEILRVDIADHNPGVVIARKYVPNLPISEASC